jgi:hypothetical protein
VCAGRSPTITPTDQALAYPTQRGSTRHSRAPPPTTGQPPKFSRRSGVTPGTKDCFADKGYLGAGGAIGTPHRKPKGRKLERRKKPFNRHHAKIRALGERGAATLKSWHILP